jgi:DnaK suppressor protein
MDRDKLEYFRQLLTERLDALINEASKTVNGLTDEKETLPDLTDRATVETDRNFQLRIRDRERKLIGKIREALDQIESGTYGICEECGDQISEQRLKARPVTTMCIDCKTSEEEEERLRGK